VLRRRALDGRGRVEKAPRIGRKPTYESGDFECNRDVSTCLAEPLQSFALLSISLAAYQNHLTIHLLPFNNSDCRRIVNLGLVPNDSPRYLPCPARVWIYEDVRCAPGHEWYTTLPQFRVKTERAGNGSQPSFPQYNLEGKVNAEFTPDRARNEGGIRSEKASRVTQC
jgi:hypothetical protein